MDRRLSARAAAPALMAAALTLAFAAQAQKFGDGAAGRTVHVERDSAASRVVAKVYEGLFSDVRIETEEPGAAPNRHPARLDAAALRAALAGVRLDGDPLLNDDQLAEIVPPLVQALARATPRQDVSFAVPGRPMNNPLLARSITTGRVFETADGLQLIVGLAHRPFESQFNATGYLIAFEPGRRAAPVDPRLHLTLAGPGRVVRGDWVSLVTEAAPAAPVAPVAPVAATAPQAPAAPMAAPARPAAAPAAPAVAPAQPAPDAHSLYLRASERLKALQRLRDEGLISAQEYEAKRREILGDL